MTRTGELENWGIGELGTDRELKCTNEGTGPARRCETGSRACQEPAICRTLEFWYQGMATTQAAERLEARLTADQKDLFRKAAELRGVTLTDFVVNSAYEAAVKTIETQRVIELNRRDQDAFVRSLLHPSAPNKYLKAAVRRYRQSGSRPPASRAR